MFITRTRTTLALAATAFVLAGCGSGDSHTMPGMDHGMSSSAVATSGTPTRTDFDNADVTFLQMMYPHHAQAVDMAQLVPSRSQNQGLLALAAAVERAQAPEMQQITTLLRSFGKPAPTTDGHAGHGMPGMMSVEQMSTLRAASGPDFDRQWLNMMIEHHTGAVAMAETELTAGTNADAQALARTIIANQRTEIDQMHAMLGPS
ncbi:DUF305 domain-containing protein [Nocardia sp. NPDC049190]|uniref:DUF305 domain-containing protein n=1 Tax=Nocardia sp. NPDC049190 TaxID=3155650 RepID=UPI0033ECF76A